MKRRILSMLLAIIMVVGLLPTAVFAAEGDNLCAHHTEHTAECGYAPAVEGSPCTHAHDDACGYADPIEEVTCTCTETDDTGAIVHTEGCGYVAAVPGSDCAHAHDDACGYAEAVEGSECTYECAECAAVNEEPSEVTAAEITGVALIVDGTEYSSGLVTLTAANTVELKAYGTNLQYGTEGQEIWYHPGASVSLGSILDWNVSPDGTYATLSLGINSFSTITAPYTLRYSNNGEDFYDSNVSVIYESGENAVITGVSITVDGENYNSGNVTIRSDSTVTITVAGSNLQNATNDQMVELKSGDARPLSMMTVSDDGASATLTESGDIFAGNENFEIRYCNDWVTAETWQGTGIYLTYDDGTGGDTTEPDTAPAEITGVSITVDGELYTEGNITITPDTQSIIYTVTGTNFANVSRDNIVIFASGSSGALSDGWWEIDAETNTATLDRSEYISQFVSCDNFEVQYSNDDQENWQGTGIYLTYDDGIDDDIKIPAVLAIGANALEEGYTYTYTAEQDGTLYVTVTELYHGTGEVVSPGYLNSWLAVSINGTAITRFDNAVEVSSGDTVTVEMEGLDNDTYFGTLQISWEAPAAAEITGVSITVDGELYTEGNVTITPDTKSVIFTLTGTNFAKAGPDNLLVYAYAHRAPLTYASIDTEANTATMDFSNNIAVFEGCNQFEVIYTNDNHTTEIGTGIYLTYDDGTGDEEPASCTCETKCADGSVNSECAVCSVEGADLSGCVGEEATADDEDGWFTVSGNTVTIDGTLGGKTTATEDDVNTLLEAITGYVDSGITTIIVTGSNPAVIEVSGIVMPAVSEAIYRLSGSSNYDENNPYNGKIDLILQDVTEIMECEFYDAFALNSITLPNVMKLGDSAFFGCYYLEKMTFGLVLTEIQNTSGATFYWVGEEVGGCDLVLNCGQMQGATDYQPNIGTDTWCYTEFKSITLAHTGGEATCTVQAVCSVCGDSYGELADHTTENDVCTLCGAMEIVVSFDAGDYNWETGDQIKLLRQSTDDYGDPVHTNYYFTATVAEDGTVTWTPDKSLYSDGTGEHTLAVSYPNMDLLYQNFGIPGDQSTLEKLREADCMNAIWSGTPTTDPITLNLTHRLAKVTVDYEVLEGVAVSKAEIYTLTQYLLFDFNTLERRDITGEEGDDLWINSYHTDNQFTAFVSPDAYAADGNFIKITLSDGTVREVKMTKAVTFAEGVEYTYKVVITADGAYLTCADECSFAYTDNGDGTHDATCTACGAVVDNEAHSGGTATCTTQAVCEACGASYGELNANNHNWENGVCTYECGTTHDPHTFENGICTVCGEEETPPAEITGVTITVDGELYTEGNVTITPETESIIVTATGTDFANVSADNIVSYASGSLDTLNNGAWTIDTEANTATQDFSGYISDFVSCDNFEVWYSNDGDTDSAYVGTGIYLTYDDGIAEEDKAQITGVTITVDGVPYTEGNVTITPTSTIVYTVTGTNFANLSNHNIVQCTSGLGSHLVNDDWTIDTEANTATQDFSEYISSFASCDNYEVQYSNDGQNTWTGAGIYLTLVRPVPDSDGKVVVDMMDSYGDGWNGAAIEIYVNGSLETTATVDVAFNTVFLDYDSTATYEFKWVQGSYDSECRFTIYVDGEEKLTVSDASGYENGQTLPTQEAAVKELAITKQPTDSEAKLGERYCVTVEAEGEGLTYQWYIKNAGATKWSKSSVTDNTYDDVMTKARMNRQVYCVITDSHGNSVTTDTASLIALKSVDLAITKEPESVTANYGERFTVTAEAVGDGVTYEWYYLDPDGEAWLSTNVRSATYSGKMSEKNNERAVYCVARDIWGNQVATNAVLLSCERAELAITKQPNDASAKLGERFNVEVIAQGDGLRYTWYYRQAGTERWQSSGVRDNTYDDVMTRARHNRQVYCVITDAWGNSVTTDIATISGIATVELEITRTPVSQTVTLGDNFHVDFEAQGDGLRYQWYFRKAGTERWLTSAQKDNSYDDVMTAARHNRELKCVVTDAWGNQVETSPVVVIMATQKHELQILQQPNDAGAKLGEEFCVTVEAQGDGLKYQWYWRNAGTETWKLSGQRDNTYDDVMTAARHNREVYCVITDMWGNQVETEVAKITGTATETLAITQQPTDGTAALGERYCVTVEATGDGLRYQWYFRNAGATRWSKSGVTDNTYDDVMTNTRAGREVYCVITDAWGYRVTTETVTLTCIESTQAIAMN